MNKVLSIMKVLEIKFITILMAHKLNEAYNNMKYRRYESAKRNLKYNRTLQIGEPDVRRRLNGANVKTL